MAYSNSPTSPTHAAWNTVRKVQIELQLESCISENKEVTGQNASRREISITWEGRDVVHTQDAATGRK